MHLAMKMVGGLALAALVGVSISQHVEDRLFVVPSAAALESTPAERDVEGAKVDGAAEALSAAQPFGASEYTRPPRTGVTIEPPPVPPAGLPQSALAVELIGTMVPVDEGEERLATVRADGKVEVVKVGSPILKERATVVEIEPRRVVLLEGGRKTVLKLGEEPAARTKVKPAAHAVTPAKKPARETIRKTGAYSFELSASFVDDEIPELLAKGAGGARVVPYIQDGKAEGLKLVGLRPGSLFRLLGLRSGDALIAVEGKSVFDASDAGRMMKRLREAGEVDVEILRRGRPLTLSYRIAE